MLIECFKIFTCGFKNSCFVFFEGVFQNILKDKGENVAHIAKKTKMPTIHRKE